MLALKNCRLISELVEGYEGQFADILIEDTKIAGLYPTGHDFGNIPSMDMENKTVLPGLFDLHAHLYYSQSSGFSDLIVRSQNEMLIACMDYASTYLSYGYTTIRDCGIVSNAGVAIKNAIGKGIIQGPRLINSGAIITPTATGNDSFCGLYVEVDRPEDLMGACRKEIAAGNDFIKYMATGSVANEGGDPGTVVTSKEELAALVKAAQSLGTYVAAHCHGKEGIKLCIEAGVRTIEHATYIDQECIDVIHQLGNQASIVATFTPMYNVYYKLSEDSGRITKLIADAFVSALKNIKLAYDSGIQVGWGSDGSMESMKNHPGVEFIARKMMGLSNIQLLKQATIDSAKIIGLDDICGTIKAGKMADLMVVDGKPDEDIEVMCKKPAYVFAEGKLYRSFS